MCDAPKLALNVSEFGQSIGVGRRKAYQLANEIGVRLDGRLIVPVAAIERWLAGIGGGGDPMENHGAGKVEAPDPDAEPRA